MNRWTLFIFVVLIASLAAIPSTHACSICQGGANTSTLRQEVVQAKLVLYGSLENPRLNENTTDLRILGVIKSDPFLGDRKVVTLSRYVPVLNPKDPPKFMVFCDVFNGKLDPYRGVAVQSAAVVDYLKGAIALDAKDSPKALQFFFRYLDHADKAIHDDAFLEFAKAGDQEVGQVARKLSPDKLSKLIEDPQTPDNRLGLYAFLLGACGSGKEAAMLKTMIQMPTQRSTAALDGLLAGYIQLLPRDGWELALKILGDEQKTFTERFAVLRMMRFYHGWKPDDSKQEVLRGLEEGVKQGDLADLAIEDLRRWQIWDLTGDVLAQFNKKSHAAPIVRRTIVRYALCCNKPEATRFVADLRKQDAELVKDVEEALHFEKK